MSNYLEQRIADLERTCVLLLYMVGVAAGKEPDPDPTGTRPGGCSAKNASARNAGRKRGDGDVWFPIRRYRWT